jgi:NAD(P)-dependent dehydrogenase (short-subunit alcohol dehydrogenase family)
VRFNNRTVLITGGTRGIGLATAKRFALEGARVVISGVNASAGEQTATSLRQEGLEISFARADSGSPQQVRDLFNRAVEILGGVDVLVSSAGITRSSTDFMDMSDEDFDAVLETNLKGAFVIGKHVARHMLETGRRGNMVFVGSVGGMLAVPPQIGYSVSKAGLSMLVKTMAVTLAPRGIRVNCLAPGPINTDMMMTHFANDPARLDMLMSRTPLGRFGTIEEIAGSIAFLASEDAGYITGQTIYADGGRLPLNYTVEKPKVDMDQRGRAGA